MSCGIIILTPFLIGEAEKTFFDLFLAYAVEIPAIFLVMALFENKRYGGRIKCTIYGLVLMIMIQVLFLIYGYDVITIGMIGLRFSFRVIWSGLNALPAESYETQLRSLGVGTAQGAGKIAGSIAAYLTLPLFYEWAFLPFIPGIILTTMCIILLLFYPIDATQKPLDLQQEQVCVDN